MGLENLAQLTSETINNSLGNEDLNKTIDMDTKLYGVNLSPIVAVLQPLWGKLAPMRQRIKRVNPAVAGYGATYKEITSIKAGKTSSPFGGKGIKNTTKTDEHFFEYKTTSIGDEVIDEAQYAGKGFIDNLAGAINRCMRMFFLIEEAKILGGNKTTLGTPAKPTVTAADTGGAIASDDYSVKVAYLTLEAINAVKPIDRQVAGLELVQDVDDANAVISGQYWGCSTSSEATTFTIGAGNAGKATISVAAKKGVMAYAWFVGEAGSETLQIITGNNSVVLTALVDDGSAAPTKDGTADTKSYDGIVPQIVAKSTFNVDFNNSQLTTDGAGGCTEVNEVLDSIYSTWNILPTTILTAPQQANDLGDLITKEGNTVKHVILNQGQGVVAKDIAIGYNHQASGQQVKIETHPLLPAGTMVFLCEEVPYNEYSSNAIEMVVPQDYTMNEWARNGRKKEFEVMNYGTLIMYHPKACAVFTNIKKGIA